MTPAQKLGYTVGMEFVVIKRNSLLSKSSIVTMVEDDGSYMPLFEATMKNPLKNKRSYRHLSSVKPITATKDKDMNYPTKGQQFTVSANLVTGSRLYVEEVLTCDDHNDLSILCRKGGLNEVVLLKSEHNFSLMPLEQPEKAPEEPEFRPVKDQAVLVRDFDSRSRSRSRKWTSCFSTGRKNEAGEFLTYVYPTNSHSAPKHSGRVVAWNQCKPDTRAPTFLNWIEHDRSARCPVEETTIVMVNVLAEGRFKVNITSPISASAVHWESVNRFLIVGNP